MSQPETFVKAINNYFLLEKNPGIAQKHHVATILNTTDETFENIRERFSFYFSYTISEKVKKFLDLIEYLTIHSTDKIRDVINTEKFLDTLSNHLTDSDFTDTICNLFRLWLDKYDKDKAKANRIFDMGENIPMFGYSIPYAYKSKYDGIDVEAEIVKAAAMADKKDELKGHTPIVDITTTEQAENFLKKADGLRNKVNSMLDSHGFNSGADFYKKELIETLTNEINPYLSYVVPKVNSLDPDMRENVENAVNSLRRCRDDLKESGNAKNTNIYDDDDNPPVHGPAHGPVYGPEPDPELSQKGLRKGDTKYFPTMLTVDELMSYKVEACDDRMRCKYAPSSKKAFQIGSMSKEIFCTGWHSMQDRRRPVFDTKGNAMYKNSMCNRKEDCRSGENCKKAHNFFEAFFHPHSYKSKKCAMVTVCNHKRYCPNYHSTEEKEYWAQILKEYFNYSKNDEVIYEEPDIWGDGSTVGAAGMYANVMKHLPPGAIIPMEDFRAHLQERPEYNRYKKEEAKEVQDVPSQKPKDKELQSMLVIRKKYVQPEKLSAALYNSPCFYGVPLGGVEDVSGGDKFVAGKEQPNVGINGVINH